MKRAFSMFELLLVVAIAAVVFSIVAPVGISLYRTQLVEEVRSNIIDALQKARHNAVLQKGDNAYGVHVVAGSYTIFQGSTYATRNESLDEIFPVVDSVVFSGQADIIFAKLTGVPTATGTIAINYNNLNRGIAVDQSGGISKVDIVNGVVVITPVAAVFFDANGGTGFMSQQSINVYSSANLNSNTFTRTNYVFTGWALIAGGEVAYANNASYTISANDVTLYAQWITVPGAPTMGTAATSTGGQATITFTPPASDGGSSITTYTAVSSPGGFTGMNTASPIIVTGLTNGTAYTFTVSATNVVGTSPASSASNSVTPSPIPSGGLIAYWPFDGDATDIFGGHNGTLLGNTVLTTGVRGVANTGYYFDGYDDRISTTGTWHQVATKSISFWAKPNCMGTTSPHQMPVATGANYYVSLHNICTSNTVYASWSMASTTQITTNKTGVAIPNAWAHYVVIFDVSGSNVNITIYVNGVSVHTFLSTAGYGTNYGGTFYIGALSASYDFGGSIDEVRLYNRILSASEISDIYNAEKPVVPNAPTSVTAATSTGSQATVTYTAPVDGGATITVYTVTSSPGGISTTTASTTAIVTGLSNGTAYTFTVTATNSVGTGPASSASNSVTPMPIPSGGLVSFWPLDGNANDSVGSNSGTITGAVATNGVRGLSNTAYGFDGVDDRISFPLIHPDDLTYAFWIKTTSAGPGTIYCTNYGNAGTCWHGGLVVSTGKVKMDIGYPLSSYRSVTGNITVNDDKWHYVVMTSSSAGSFLYVDGVLDVSSIYYVGQVPGTSETNTNIGTKQTYNFASSTWDYLNNFGGSIDQARIYDRALSVSEISDIYNAEKPVVPNAPTSVTAATSTGSQATVTYTAPVDGGATITVYTVTSSPGGISTTTASTTAIVTGLSNGTAYTFTVTATNSVGTGPASSASNSVTPMPIPSGGLVSFWPLDGNANDAMGNHNGTVNGGAVPTTGVRGIANTAYTFDGVDDYISAGIGSNYFPLSLFSICAWEKTPGLASGMIINGIVSITYGLALRLQISGYFNTYMDDGSNNIHQTTNQSLHDNNFHHLCLTYDGTNRRMYVDSVEKISVATTWLGTTRWPTNGFSIGHDNNDPSRYKFNGTLDNIRIYNRALSASEVSDIYNAEKPVVPDAPVISTVTVGNAQATVSYTAPVNGGAVIDYYTVISSPGGITSATTSATSVTVSGLTKGTAYTFQIYAHNSVGTSTPSNASNSVTPVNTLYWVGGTASWNTATNWSQSSGGAGNGWVPTASDNVIFNGGNVSNCTLDVNAVFASLNVTTAYTGILAFGTYTVTGSTAGDITLNIGTGGTVNLGSSIITCDGNFDWSGAAGTITQGTSVLVMTGTGKNLAAPYNSSPARSLRSLTIAEGATTTFLNVGALLTWGLFTLNGAVINNDAVTQFSGGMTQGANGTMTGTGQLYLNGGTFTFANSSAITPATIKIYEGTGLTLPPGIYSPTAQMIFWNNGATSTFAWSAGTYTFTSSVQILNNTNAGTLTISAVNNPTLIFQKDVIITQTTGTIVFTNNSTNPNQLTGTAAQTINLLGKNMGTWVVNKPTSGNITWTSGDTITAGGAWSMVNLTVPAGVIIDTSANNYAVTLSGNFDQSSITSKFLARASTITINGNGTFTADGTVDSTQYNSASLVLNGTNTLTYNNLSNYVNNGFNNLTVGQSGNTTTLSGGTANFEIGSVLTIGSGTLTGGYNIYLAGANPLSFDANSHLSINILRFWGTNQTIPNLANGYDCNLATANYTNSTVTQTGDITLNGSNYLILYNNTAKNGITTWKTDGYNMTVGGNLTIGAGADTGLKKLDATRNGARTSTITVGGNWLNYGNGTASSTFVADNSTVVFNATTTGKTITSGAANSPFYNLTFNGTGGVWTLQDNLVAGGNLLHSAGTLSLGGKNITTTGNLTVSDGALVTPTGLVGSTITVGGNFSASGHAGALLTLNPTSLWYLNVTGTANASYVNAAYSNASGGTVISQTNSTNGGNNTNWSF